ncbi:MAG: IgGFc-binding protein [Polyangiaceae bacterium]|nr:IgGFc-binding protein [Polyangiaceae bacterium]
MMSLSCSASSDRTAATGSSGGNPGECGQCVDKVFTPCKADGTPGPAEVCPNACVPDKGCAMCVPDSLQCVGNEVRKCSADGSEYGETVEVCDVLGGGACSNGKCTTACNLAADQPSNVGCEFWAVDLDQFDLFNNPAAAPWGVAISNAGQSKAHVVIELNSAPYGQAPVPMPVWENDVNPGELFTPTLPTREVDCSAQPGDAMAPGTCLSSNAYRITSSAPIVVYQFNVFENAYSNDASLLIPTTGLGQIYRVINWGAGHPVPLPGFPVDRSYITVVGTKPNTKVTVKPTWKIRGNPPIAPTPAGTEIVATLGPFDVLNLETDDATLAELMSNKSATDLTASVVTSDKPVAVFSGVELTAAPGGAVDIPTYPGWTSEDTCCLDHLEDQMLPVESIGSKYVITRSPVRSTSNFREPDVIRFMGVAEQATITTTLPPPYDSFTLAPGEFRTTYAQNNFVVNSDKPVMVGQLLISQEYVDGPYLGDPALTVFPPIDQFRTEYVIPTPPKWTQHWVVITAETGAEVMLDDANTFICLVEPAGMIEGKTYESRKCSLQAGAHRLTGEKPFGIVVYGYGTAGSYAFVGGADVKRVYEPPPLK